MIKVLEVCTDSSPCYALVFKRALGVMQSSQHPIQVDLLCNEGKEVELMREQGVDVITTTIHRSLNPIRLFQSFLNLRKIIKHSDYDVVHLHFGIPGLIGRLLAFFDRKREYICQSHGYSIAENTSWFAKQVFLIIERVFRSTVRYSLFQLQEDVELARKYHLLSEEQIIYTGNGIDLQRFKPRSKADTDTKAIDDQDDNVLFGMVGRFEPIKNQALLIDAAYVLKKQQQNFKIYLIGQGELKDEVQTQIDQLQLNKHVEILAYTHDMPAFYQTLDVAVLTSFAEGIPRALIEPMASGIPVIATDVKGSREAVLPGKTGYLTPLGEPQQLADIMANMINHPEQRTTMGINAREHAVQNFSEQRIIEKLADIYHLAAHHNDADKTPLSHNDTLKLSEKSS